jgi:DNA-binding NarL/FixJ family response regulator
MEDLERDAARAPRSVVDNAAPSLSEHRMNREFTEHIGKSKFTAHKSFHDETCLTILRIDPARALLLSTSNAAGGEPMIRLGIAEDHTIVRWALREALGKADDIEVVGEAGTVAETLEMIQNVRPDVLLLDLTLPDRSGFDVLNELRVIDTAPLVVVLTWHTEPSYAARAIAAGAHGYLNKGAAPEELLNAIRAVSRGEQIIPPDAEQLIASGDGHPASALTAREQQVMEMLARGLTNREIAEHLEISIKTVDTHRGHVLKKLGLRNNSELTRFAVKHGYVAL